MPELPSGVASIIGEALHADEALSLSQVDRKWFAELAQPSIWQRYLNGPPDLLARPVLSDRNTGALFTGPSVHPQNFRAIVAALRQPSWFRHYQGMKRLAGSGRLSQPKGLNSGVLRQLRQRLRSDVLNNELQGLQGKTTKRRRRSLELALQKLHSQRQQMRLEECGFQNGKRDSRSKTYIDLDVH
ncbi:unnamed protein product [Symbiodinium natans]|uniref:F-box domain-containing protein n=1 Tax=Symbiodinium natans TaxID=878477 RepID=A0A812JFQ8_9DINO|nr:unnamed protein product [Symbiodinium natans]